MAGTRKKAKSEPDPSPKAKGKGGVPRGTPEGGAKKGGEKEPAVPKQGPKQGRSGKKAKGKRYSAEYIAAQFKPGQTGNPKGRPPSRGVSKALRAWSANRAPQKMRDDLLKEWPDLRHSEEWGDRIDDMSVDELIGLRLMLQAMNGDLAYIREYLDRTEGRAKQFIAVSDGDKPPEEMTDAEFADALQGVAGMMTGATDEGD